MGSLRTEAAGETSAFAASALLDSGPICHRGQEHVAATREANLCQLGHMGSVTALFFILRKSRETCPESCEADAGLWGWYHGRRLRGIESVLPVAWAQRPTGLLSTGLSGSRRNQAPGPRGSWPGRSTRMVRGDHGPLSGGPLSTGPLGLLTVLGLGDTGQVPSPFWACVGIMGRLLQLRLWLLCPWPGARGQMPASRPAGRHPRALTTAGDSCAFPGPSRVVAEARLSPRTVGWGGVCCY